MHRILPPLLDSPCEGELHLVLSGARVSPSLSAELDIVVSGKWWGDNEAFSCRMSAPEGSAKAVFGVCCNGSSFRQYLLDAKTLVLALHTHFKEEIKEKDLTPSISDQHNLNDNISKEIPLKKSSVESTILKPLNSSPSKRLQSFSPWKKRSPTKSKPSVMSAADLPEYLLGTPRHRLLEKQRTAWLPGEEVGEVVVSSLKLNSRGELMCQCNIVNMFGDERGTLDVTMIYYENIALLKSSLEENKVLSFPHSSKAVFSLDKGKYLSSENKENVNRVSHNELPSSSVVNESSNMESITDLSEFSNQQTESSHHISYGEIPQTFGNDSSRLMLCGNENFGERRGSSVSLSDESVLAYLRQLDPQSLVECGAIRKDDLPKFLKLIQDCTLEDENYPEMPVPRSSELTTSAYCSARSDKARQAADSSVNGTADANSARSIEMEIGDFRPDVLLAHNSATESTKVFDANFNSRRCLELNNNGTIEASCSDNTQRNFTDVSRSSQPVSHDNQRLNKTNFYTARPGNVLNSPRNIFSNEKTWNSSQEAAAVGPAECPEVVCSEPSVMSLPSGVWPLDDSPAFSQLPFRDADKELGIPNLNQRGDNDRSWDIHQDPGLSHASKSPKLDVCSDHQTSAYQFPPDEGKVLDDSFLSKLKYKAITSDGKEIMMDCKRLAQLTQPQFHFADSHVQPMSDWKENIGENLNHPRTLQSDSPVPQRKLWKNLKNNINSPMLVDSQLGASRPQDLFDTARGEMPSPWQNNQEDSDAESDTSGASNETYTTSTLNNPDESPTHASPGSVLLVEVKELTLRGAASPLQHSTRPGLRGVKNRSNVCILTSLTVSAPAPCEAALSSPSADVPFLTPPQTHALLQEQHSDQGKALSQEAMGPNKPQHYAAQMHGQVLPQSQVLPDEQLIARGQVPSREGVLPPAQQRGEEAGSPTPGDGGLQTITLASRHLDKDTVHYGSVQAFGLSGLKDPAQLQKVTLLIRVFRRVLGRQKSEELCSAEISLWDVYRLVHGHLVIPLSPTPSCAARATRHSSVDDAVLRSPSRLVPSRRSAESGAENQRMVHSNDSEIIHGSYNDFSKKRGHSPRHGVSGSRLSAGNVRSTHADRDFPSGGGMPARGRGFKCLRGSKPNPVRNNDVAKPVSGEISIFLKLFLNEQYVNEFRNSIVEDPSVLASFVQRRRCGDQQGLEDSVEADVITVLPNLNRSQTTRLLDHVTRHNDADLPSVQSTGDFSTASCSLFKLTNAPDNIARDAFRTNGSEATRKSTLMHSSAGNPPVANVNIPTENHSLFQLMSGNQVDISYSSGRVVKTRDGFSESGLSGPKMLEELTGQSSKRMIQQVSKSPTRQLSESSTELVAQPLTLAKYESQTRRTFESSARTLPHPSVTSPRPGEKEQKSKLTATSAPLECVLGSSSDPSVSFIQTLSQQYHQNTEYFIRIHVEILEAKNLESVSDGLGGRVPPCSYVRASFFGEDVTTAVCGPSTSPVWNFASQIVVSSLEINNGCSSIVVRVHHRGREGAPLLGCLALRPPSPFWPGQVSLCGWYPLLSVRARLAGHIKLSLTIVESVLGDENSGTTHPIASSAPAASASSAPGLASHTSRRQPSTRVDCPGASSSDHESRNSPVKTQLFGLNDSYQSSAQHDSYRPGATSTECNINGFRDEVNLSNSLGQNGGVNDRILFEESVPNNRILPKNEYMNTAVLEKRVLNEHGHLTSRANDHCRSWDQVSSNSKQERSSSASVDRSASHLDYANHSIERDNTRVESKGDVSEDYFVSRASYLASDSKWGCSGQSNKNFNSSLNPRVSMSTSTNTVSLLQRNPSAPSPVCSVLEPVTSCARKGREDALSVEPLSSCLKSSAFSVRSVTDVEARAGLGNILPDTYMRQRENDYTCSQPPYNVELMNDVLPAASSFPSCLRTVDSPRGLSKKVKFAVDKRLSLSSVSATCTSGLDHPQEEILSKYEETSRGCESSSAREPFHKHSQDSGRITGEKLSSQHKVSVAAVEGRLHDIQHKLYSPPLRRSCDQESSSKECYNYRSEKQGAEHMDKYQHLEKYQHMDRLVDRSTTTAPESKGVKVAAETRNIASLLESFSWMNLVKDNDSPCVSYIDAVKRPSTPSRNSEFYTDHHEHHNARVAKSDAPSNYVLISRQSPVTDSGLTSEVGSSSHRSSDADSPRCVASPDAVGRDRGFGTQTLLETQASAASNPRLSAERKNNPKSRLAANFSFNKRPR